MKRPNILLIIADQLRSDALGCYGNNICLTPHLDGLAAEGACFDNTYTVAPVCSPARCSMLTGLYPHTHKVQLNTHVDTRTSNGLDPTLPTFSKIMKDLGEYRMHYLGKWHVHQELSPTEFGFDSWQPYPNHIPPDHLGNCQKIQFLSEIQLVNAVHVGEPEELGSYRIAQAGASFLKKQCEDDKPFFLRLDFTQPHFSNIVPKKFADMYAETPIPQWKNFNETFENKPYGHFRKHKEWALEDKDWSWWEKVVRMYYADVSYLDDCCGIVLDTLRRLSIANDTIVIFTADHGDPTGMHRHFEKGGTMYDEVMRVPMIVKWPGKAQPGQHFPQMIRNMDICPTILKMAGLEPPADIHAKDFSCIVDGSSNDWYDSVYTEYHGDVWGMYTQRMVRTVEWKYVYNPYDMDELYNMKNDPYELHNLIDNPDYHEAQLEMRSRFINWVDETNDVLTYSFVRRMFPDAAKRNKNKKVLIDSFDTK